VESKSRGVWRAVVREEHPRFRSFRVRLIRSVSAEFRKPGLIPSVTDLSEISMSDCCRWNNRNNQ